MTTTATNNNQVDILLQDLGAEPLFAAVQDQQSKNSFSNLSAQHAPYKQEPMEARDVYDSLMKRITPTSQPPPPEQSLSINNHNIQLATPNPISILNELHQRLRTGKLPIYEFLIEPTSGRFDCKLEIFGKTYRTNQPRTRKQQAKEDVALIALKDIVNENTHPAIADSVGQDVLNHFEPPDKNSIAENFLPKSEIWYRKQLSDHPEKKPRVILLEYCQMKRLPTPEYRGRTDERGRYFFDCAIGDRIFSAEGEFCEQERQHEKNNRINSDNLPGKGIISILPSPGSLPTINNMNSMNTKRTLTINDSNNQTIQNNCIGLNLSSTANDISTANLVLPSLNDQNLQFTNDSHESSRIQSLTASLLPTNSEQSLMPTLSSTTTDRSSIPTMPSTSSSTDRPLMPTMSSTNNIDRSLFSKLPSNSKDRSIIQTLPSISTDRSFVPTLPSTSTDRFIPTITTLSSTLSSTNTDRAFSILPSTSTDRSFPTLPSTSNDRSFSTLSSTSTDRSFSTLTSTNTDRSSQISNN
ncbi:6900_t:CDS:2, partial [Gigaspora rosea]